MNQETGNMIDVATLTPDEERNHKREWFKSRLILLVHYVIRTSLSESDPTTIQKYRRAKPVLLCCENGAFIFQASLNQTPMGGNRLTILYNGNLVFQIYYQNANFDPSHCEIKELSMFSDWFPILEKKIGERTGRAICGPGETTVDEREMERRYEQAVQAQEDARLKWHL